MLGRNQQKVIKVKTALLRNTGRSNLKLLSYILVINDIFSDLNTVQPYKEYRFSGCILSPIFGKSIEKTD